MKKQPKEKRSLNFKGRIAVVVLALLCGLLFSDWKIRPIIHTMAEYQAKIYATQFINDAVYEELAREDVGYGQLVTLTQNDQKQVTSIQTDMVKINHIKTNVTTAALQHLTNMSITEISIPIGTLLGGQILSGRGPNVPFRIIPAGYAQSELENQFLSAGINQTVHKIMLHISINITAVLPGYSISTTVNTNFCIAETVIVGTVPDAYTKIQLNGEVNNLPGLLAGYSTAQE